MLKHQVTEHVETNKKKKKKHHTQHLGLNLAGIFHPDNLLRTVLPSKITCMVFFKSFFKLVHAGFSPVSATSGWITGFKNLLSKTKLRKSSTSANVRTRLCNR